ncbi:MAG TPA: DegT/DnrJ/EryC1/StrS aminotransferase family protein [Spirochaetaceae bacterium]|nr:DegT/DnrJ/EryC1/StrS aminotransferase family protein [Spirochaetaceae bacterium]
MIPLYCSFIRRKDMDTVLGCLVTDSIGTGEYTEKFLKNAKEIFGYEAAIALRSPYQALTIALKKIGLPPGAKIGLSPLAPLYHLSVVEDMGFSPVFIDHDPETCLPELQTARERGCSAIVLFEAFGMLPDKTLVLATELPVIEDMSQALGAFRADTKAGTTGNFALYGLEQGSPVTTGGGALLFAPTKRDAPVIRNIAETLPREIVLTDYNAALGLAQLRTLGNSLERRRTLEGSFQMELARSRHRTFRQADEGQGGCYTFPVVLESSMKDVVIHAKRNGVEAAPAFGQSIIAKDDFPADECPGAKLLALRCVLFPLHEKIAAKDANIIAKVLATLP